MATTTGFDGDREADVIAAIARNAMATMPGFYGRLAVTIAAIISLAGPAMTASNYQSEIRSSYTEYNACSLDASTLTGEADASTVAACHDSALRERQALLADPPMPAFAGVIIWFGAALFTFWLVRTFAVWLFTGRGPRSQPTP